MAGQYLSPHQRNIVNRYYANTDSRINQKLAEVVSDLAVEQDPKKIAVLWQSAHTALKSTPADAMKVGRLIAQRDLKGLAQLVEQLGKEKLAGPPRAGADSGSTSSGQGMPTALSAPTSTPSAPSAAAVPSGPTPDQLKSALSAFKKRLKISRLDAESKLGGRGLTGGKASGIVAIQPPNQFPKAVWDALVAEGKLKYSGSGLYELKE